MQIKVGGLTKINYLGYGLGDFGECMTFAIMGSFLTPYYTDVAGLAPASIAGMYLILKIWDAINDPLMGALMDKVFAKTHSEKGKLRPWMLRATPLLAICAVLMFTAPTYVDGAGKLVAAFVTYLLYEGCYTVFSIPYGSLLSAMAKNDAERASCSSARGLGAQLGNILPTALFPILLTMFKDAPETGYVTGVTVCAVIGFVACLLSCKFTVERGLEGADGKQDADEIKFTDIFVTFRKNRSFVALCIMAVFFCIQQYVGSTMSVYMYRDVLGALPIMSMNSVVNMGFSFLVLSLLPKLSEKFGMVRVARVSQVLAIVAFIVTYLLPLNPWVYLVSHAIASVLASSCVFLQWGMIGEAIDYNELVTGKRTEGSIFGIFNLTRRIGQGVGSSVAVLLLGTVGYVADAASQSAATIGGIKALALLVPAACMLGCWLALRFVWSITPEIRAKIDAYMNAKSK